MRSVKVALVVGLALTVVAIGTAVARSPLTLAGTNSVPEKGTGVLNKGDESSCQPAGTLPQGTTAIRVALEAVGVGPRVDLRVLSGSHLVTEGERGAGWGTATSVTVPVKRVSHTVRDARVCTSIGPTVEPYQFRGTLVKPTATNVFSLPEARLLMEYLRPSSESWWSLVPSIAYHMGLGHAASGTWLVFLALILMIAVTILASRLVVEQLR